MINFIFGVFLILHGTVFYLYAGHSARLFELEVGMNWPYDSWALSKIFRKEVIKELGSIFCIISGTGIIVSGIEVLFSGYWRQEIVIISCVFSSTVIFLLWNGSLKNLPDQGFVGVFINLLIMILILFFNI